MPGLRNDLISTLVIVITFLLLLGLYPLTVQGETWTDDFEDRSVGSTDFSSPSTGGISWSVQQGGLIATVADANNTVTMRWPVSLGMPQDTLVLADQPGPAPDAAIRFGWASKYVRKTAEFLLLYQDESNHYKLTLGSNQNGKLIRIQNGISRELASGLFAPPDVGDKALLAYRVEYQISESFIEVRINRGDDESYELIFRDSDSSAVATFGQGGKIGFHWGSDNGSWHPVWIDEVEISNQLRALPSLSPNSELVHSDDFAQRALGANDLSTPSEGNLAWQTLEGGVQIAEFSPSQGQAMNWPLDQSAPSNTTVLTTGTEPASSAIYDFGWSSRYCRGTAGVLLRYIDPDNYYFLSLATDQQGRLTRVMDGAETVLASGLFAPPDAGDTVVTNYRVLSAISENELSFVVNKDNDNTFELTYLDSDPTALLRFATTGQAGFRWQSDNGPWHPAWISSFAVSKIIASEVEPEPEPTPTEVPSLAETLRDDFTTRSADGSNLAELSPGGISWEILSGGIRVTANQANNSPSLNWPENLREPSNTLILAQQGTDWSRFSVEFGWSSKYVRRTAGVVLLAQSANDYYFLRLGSSKPGELQRIINGTAEVLATGDFSPPDVGDQIVTAYRIDVDIQPGGIQFSVDRGKDGSEELFFSDTSGTALSVFGEGGASGFYWDADNDPWHQVWVESFELSTQGAVAGVKAIADLQVVPAEQPGGYRFSFTPPDGDPATPGEQIPMGFDIRYSETPINNWDDFLAATPVSNRPDPGYPGQKQFFESYSLPVGPLYFAMVTIGTDATSDLSNVVSCSASEGSAVWYRPASQKTGIDLLVAGQPNRDFAYETLYYDGMVDDHGILYLRDDVELKFAHNEKNAKPFPYWEGGTPGVQPNTSVHSESLAGSQGMIRYRLDADGLWKEAPHQAYVVDGQTYGVNRYKEHPFYHTYEGSFTPKSLYDGLTWNGCSTPEERVGRYEAPEAADSCQKGYRDSLNGNEWHELAYWDDDFSWLGNGDREAQASDGKIVWIVLNPRTPVPTFRADSGGKFFTTRPKAYYQGKVVPQTTYFSGPVSLTISNLSTSADTIQYRIGDSSWQIYQAPIALAELGLPENTELAFETRLGDNGPVLSRTLVANPTSPSAAEEHPVLLVREDEKTALKEKIRTDPVLAAEYEKLKTNGNQVNALMTRDYYVEERVDYLLSARQTLSAAFLYYMEGTGPIANCAFTGKELATKAWEVLLCALSSYDPIGDESQAGQWATPCGEICSEWWDRGLNAKYALMTYDLLAGGAMSIDPIIDLKVREALAQEAYLKMAFASEKRGNWNLKSSIGLACAAYAMPSFDSPAFGGAQSTQYDGHPFTPGLSWAEYIENPDLPEGQPQGPRYRSSIWKTVWEDGMTKESSSYDVESRVFLSYFLNLYAGYRGTNLMEEYSQFRDAYQWSLQTRYPWNRHYQSYGQARLTWYEDMHLVMNPRFAGNLNLGELKWHYEHHDPPLSINPGSREPLPLVLAWHDPTITAEKPSNTGSNVYYNNMIFQDDFTNPEAVQLLLWGRMTSWDPSEAHRKDDTTSIFLNAFGDRFLTNTDEYSDWLRSNAESQNVILVDDEVPGPENTRILSGPSRATVATIRRFLTSPRFDYGMIETQPHSENDQSAYADKVQLNRHVLFPEHRFYVVFDELTALDQQNHTFGWTGHCYGDLSLVSDQEVRFTKASGNLLQINFLTRPNQIKNYQIPMKLDWTDTIVNAPYVIAERTGVGTHFLTLLLPLKAGTEAATVNSVACSRGEASEILWQGERYLVHSQPGTPETVQIGDLSLQATMSFARIGNTGNLEYLFVHNQLGEVVWQGKQLLKSDSTDSLLYFPEDPNKGGPGFYRVKQQ